jgi:putative ABC transport system permease protein
MGIESFARDLRYAVRGLVRTPTYTMAAIFTLALGIGATTAIFSVVNAVLLRSLPYDAPDRIVRAWDHTRDGEITDFSFRVVEYRALRARSGAFRAVGAEFPFTATVHPEDGEPRQIQGRMVTSDFFRVFGVEPAPGRMFTADEIAGGDRRVAVVSYEFWSRHLGADPAAVGRTVDLDGNAFTVLGVLPEGYRHVRGSDAHVFVPYTIGTRTWTGHWLDLYGRLEPGVSHDRAAEEINAVLQAVGSSDRRSARWYATVEGLHEMVVGDVRTTLWALFAVVALVLLLACVNVANLTLARSTSRLHEVALRKSLGAGPGRLLRLLLVENLVVAGVGGVLGLALAAVALDALVRLAPPSIPRIGDTGLDATVLGFAFLATVATIVVFGLGPAVRTVRGTSATEDLARSRRDTGRGGLHRLLSGLVVIEVALTLTLLVAAGLTVRTVQHLQGEDLGFDRSGALTFRVSVASARYPSGEDTHAFYTRLRKALEELPGTVAVGAGTDLPVSGEGAVATVTSEERLRSGVEEGVTVLQRRATEGFFRALGTRVIAGRGFDRTDRRDGPPVAVVSESLAQELFGEEEAVGRRIGWGSAPQEDDWMTVVGVVEDVRYERVEGSPDPQVYQAHAQSASRDLALVLRTQGDPIAMLEPAETVLHSLDPQIPVYSAGTLGGLVDTALAGRRFTALLFGLFAVVALALTVAGLYGVLAFAVGQRRREIGVRMAVGASGREVARLVLRRGFGLIMLGLGIGLLGALLAGRLLRGMLVGVSSFDPMTSGVVGAILLAVGVVACLAPALGAARVDPAEALREA